MILSDNLLLVIIHYWSDAVPAGGIIAIALVCYLYDCPKFLLHISTGKSVPELEFSYFCLEKQHHHTSVFDECPFSVQQISLSRSPFPTETI